MIHPDVSRWADFVRGLGGETERAELRRHLEDGCTVCAGRLASLEKVTAVAAADGRLAPPASALRLVQALALLAHPERRSRLDALALVLRGDTARDGVTAGTRSGEPPAGRQLHFASAGCVLELSVEGAAGSAASRTVVGGCSGPEGRPLTGAAVLAVAGGRVVGRTRTGEIGEFQLGGLPAERFELWLISGGERPLVAELDLAS